MSRMGMEQFLGALAGDAALWADFEALCDTGGRLAGTSSEAAALDWAEARLATIPGGTARRDPTPYAGWRCHEARLTDLATGRELAVAPLLGTQATPPEGLVLDTIDLRRGGPAEIAAAGDAVRGQAVLARHEYAFASHTIHRRVKLNAAREAGAAAFLIVQPEPGIGPVSGSSGRGGGPGIPALGISAEVGALLATGRRVRLTVSGEDLPQAATGTLILDLPGRSDERVVLSAHIDGHPLAESALDNATGVATALALARAAAPLVGTLPRGLTVCLFSAEEWALAGSRNWLAQLPPAVRDRMVLNLNLDSLCGSPRLTALTSGFAELGPFVQGAAAAVGLRLGAHLPLMPNSDHANFAAIGIPALRLIAGFDEPDSTLRLLLTGADTRALVVPGELKAAALTAGAVLWAALSAQTSAEWSGASRA